MPQRQLRLFRPPKPLLDRLGEDFFRNTPREPGVYLMTGRNERVLYVGQSKDLRVRLAAYKNAQPDRASRKVIQLVHQVDSIVWEKCADAEAARLRENELLRLHRPRFNSLNVFPKASVFLWLQADAGGLEIGWTRTAQAGKRLYGAFKPGSTLAFAALLRLLWTALRRPDGISAYPLRLLGPKPPREYRIEFPVCAPQVELERLPEMLAEFLDGISGQLLDFLRGRLPEPEMLGPFLRALHKHDLELLAAFYESGPGRNRKLKTIYPGLGRVISQELLDDLLALKALCSPPSL